MYSAHLARWDIIISALGYGALSIQMLNARRRPAHAAVAGLLVGLALEVHPHAFLFAPVALGLFLGESGWRFMLRRDAWAWLAGFLVGLVVYFLLHIAPNPASFLALGALAHGPTHVPPLATFDALIMVSSVISTGHLLNLANPFFLFAFAFSGIWLALSRTASRWPLAFALLVWLSFSLLVRNKFRYYAILVTPALNLVVAAFLVDAAKPIRRLFPAPLACALVLTSLILGVAANMLVLRNNGSGDLAETMATIEPLVGPRDVVMGAQTYWLGLTEHRYYSWEQLVYYKRHYPESSLEDAMREYRPDVFILDDHVESFVKGPNESGSYSGQLNVPRRELFSFLDSAATLVSDFKNPSYGRVRVYRIDWTQRGPRGKAHEGQSR